MGKLCHQRRNRARMTAYNIAKAKEVNEIKDYEIELREKEIHNLNVINKELRDDYASDIENALTLQKQDLNEKHKIIMKNYTEDLKASYTKTFDSAVKSYQKEISLLKVKLAEEKSSRLRLNIRRPVYSPGRYSSADSVDFSSKSEIKTDGEVTYPVPANTNSGIDDHIPVRRPVRRVIGKIGEIT